MTPQRILLVDDLEINCILAASILRGATYEVDSVEDGTAALRALDDKRYDLILMDLDMPGMDGHSTAAAIKQRNDRDMPKIAAFSADTNAASRSRSETVGMVGHIRRPIAPLDLLREVGRLLAVETREDQACLWCMETYVLLVESLGEPRMRAFLRTFCDLCEQMRDVLAGSNEREAKILPRAHDLLSVGGMLGFEIVARLCLDLQSSPVGTRSAARLQELDFALGSSIAALAAYLDGKAAAA